MRRFLFACWPFVGHVNPQISIARTLQARGHAVSFYTGSSARPILAGEGFGVHVFQHVNEERAYERLGALEAGHANTRRAHIQSLRTFIQWLAESIPAQVADLQPILQDWQPDVVVTETAMWGPSLVLWERTCLPVAISSTLLGCLIPGPQAPVLGLGWPPPRGVVARLLARAVAVGLDLAAIRLRREVDRIRASYGLPRMGCAVNAFTARLPLYLIPSLPELDYNRRDLPANVHYVGPCVWNKPSSDGAPTWLNELPTDVPWVHVTEGTAQYQDPFLLRAAARGLATQPLQVILTTGGQRDPDQLGLGPLAPNVRLERWVSHADLLPRCAALVTTGGAGTIKSALQAGIPLVVVPTLWDKADNAQRVVEAGVGLRLDPRRCTAERLRRALWRVLSEPSFRANAQRMAERFAAQPGPPRAADLLIQLAQGMPAAERATDAVASDLSVELLGT